MAAALRASRCFSVDARVLIGRAELGDGLRIAGLNEASNILTLCSAHHRAVHRAKLLINRDGDGHRSSGTPMAQSTATR